jgi:hypothetical protein
MDEKLNKALDLYADHFNGSFPMFAMSAEPIDKVVEFIEECIQEDKDVYELGYLGEDAVY